MPTLDAVLTRVEKLLALATSNNVHEAGAAAARAQALIAEHRLASLLEARAAGAGMGPDPVGDEVVERARRPRAWRGVLAQGLAAANGCVAYSVSLGPQTELRLAGRAEDRRVVLALFSWLAPRLEWLSASHGAGRERDWHDAFRVGAAEEVTRRLAAGGGSPPELPPGDTAAVALLDRDAAARRTAVDAWAEAHLRLGRGRGLRVDERGYARGKEAAGELGLPKSR